MTLKMLCQFSIHMLNIEHFNLLNRWLEHSIEQSGFHRRRAT